MCSIYGTLHKPAAQESLGRAWQAAVERARPRGPDGRSVFESPGLRLGHSALKTTGDSFQPFEIQTGSLRLAWAVNGQFYGHKALRPMLEERGACFKTDCDSEILGWIWLLLGKKGLELLRGEFSFAIAEIRGGAPACLALGRDENGTRPLCWAQGPLGLGFATHWQSAAGLAGVAPEPDPLWLRETFELQYPPPDRRCAKGVFSVAPGELLEFSPQSPMAGPRSSRFAPLAPVPCFETPAEARQAILLRFCTSVSERLPEIPFACALSSGLDSAAVCAAALEAGARPAAYCVDFEDDPAQSEFAQARLHAEMLGLELRRVPAGVRQALEELPRMAALAGANCMDAHLCAKAALARAVASDGLRVILTGEGSDEAFLGYAHFLADSGQNSQEFDMRGAHTPLAPFRDPLCEQTLGFTPAWIQAKLEAARGIAGLMRPEFAALPARQSLLRFGGAPSPRPPGAGKARLSALAWRERAMRGYILPAVDDAPCAMLGVESRMAFLDPALCAAAEAAPDAWHLEGGRSKALLRQALAPILPPAVAAVPKRPFMGPSLGAACQKQPAALALAMDILLADSPFWDLLDKQSALARCRAWIENPSKGADSLLWQILSAKALWDSGFRDCAP